MLWRECTGFPLVLHQMLRSLGRLFGKYSGVIAQSGTDRDQVGDKLLFPRAASKKRHATNCIRFVLVSGQAAHKAYRCPHLVQNGIDLRERSSITIEADIAHLCPFMPALSRHRGWMNRKVKSRRNTEPHLRPIREPFDFAMDIARQHEVFMGGHGIQI